jgi:glycosyltransferase involved in cell wall biosynthesis
LFFILSKLLKLPTILHCHSGYFQAFYSEARWIENRYISMVLSRADCLFLVSDFWKAYFKTICPSTSSTIIYNPVAMPESVMLRDIEGYNVLTVGRLGKNKGTYDILRAVPDVVEAYPEVLFLFAGDGEIDNVRNILGQEQWQSNVKLLGWVEGERKRRAYEEADVFLLPSYHEALPLAILEAMAYGLAIITTPVGGIPDAIEDGVTGILVEPGNSSMIAAAISDLFDDRERARILGDSARLQAMREYEINNVLQMVYEAYDRLIDTRET